MSEGWRQYSSGVTTVVLLVLTAAGCRGCRESGDVPTSAPTSAASSLPAGSASLGGASLDGAVLDESALGGDWELAATGDALASARLAELHSAPVLWAVAAGNGVRARAALEALAHSVDGELVLMAMADAARRSPRRREAILAVILALASRAPRSGEPLDPPSLAHCIKQLDALSRDSAMPRRARVLAVSALRAFARGGYLDGGRITAELDPTP